MTDQIEDPDDTNETVAICVDDAVLSQAALRALHVRILDTMSLHRTVHFITRAGLTKILRAGYTRGVDQAIAGYQNLMLIQLVPPAVPREPGEAPRDQPAPVALQPVPVAPAVAVTMVDATVSSAPVRILSWNGCSDSDFVKAFRQLVQTHLSPVVRRERVTVRVPHGGVRQFDADPSAFQILIWSSPDKGQRITVPGQMWDIEVAQTMPADIGVWELGYQITSPEGVVGAWDDNGMCLYWDAIHAGKQAELDILAKVFEAVALAFAAPRQNRLEVRREEYVRRCAGRLEKIITETRSRQARLASDIESAQSSLVALLRSQRDDRFTLQNVANLQKQEHEVYTREFDSLLANARVRDVRFTDNKISVFTNLIYATDDRSYSEHELGCFKVTIDQLTSTVNITNLTRQVDGYGEKMHAPHVYADGVPCWGNVESLIPKMVAAFEYSMVFDMAVALLESPDTNDAAGKYVEKWPLRISTKTQETVA
jgi:hypothetical protein